MGTNRKIKGITIEIDGNATKLGAALKDIDKLSSNLSGELKNVNSLLKFNPESIELTTQKQDILRQEIENTTKKLNLLRDAQQNIEKQWEKGDIGDEELRAFQREIIATESELNRYKQQLGNTKTELEKLGNEETETTQDTEQFKQQLEDAKTELKDFGENAKDSVEKIITISSATTAVGSFVNSADDMNTAMNSLQVQTGFTSDEMERYKDVLEDIYRNNYGENLEDVAGSMALIKQYTGEIDPSALKEMTIDGITLRDTFDMDLSETIRAVDALMINMGIDAKTAFNLIATGAQNGLNKSGELCDNIAEYSQLWGQAEFSADEMFAILQNGLESGAYNLDKVNDFVKEFTISLSDGRIEENISSFSTETRGLFESWKSGGASASEVFYSVINDLSTMTNQQEALTIASNTWSALGEDNAMSVITSLGNVNDAYKNVEGTMESIQDIKYDDMKNDWSTLGREIKLDIIQPLGEKALPLVRNFFKSTEEHLDDIIPALKSVGTAFVAAFTINKVKNVTSELGKAKTALSTLYSVASANPIAAAVVGLGALATAGISLYESLKKDVDAFNEAYQATRKLDEAEQSIVNTASEVSQAYSSMIASRDENNSKIADEYTYYDQLYDELTTIVDKNGQVKEGYESRAEVITGTLADALGLEIEMTDGVIENYAELNRSIEEVIRTKEAEALLNANESAYVDAISKRSAAYTSYIEALEAANNTETELQSAREELAAAIAAKNSAEEQNRIDDVIRLKEHIDELNGTISGLSEQYEVQTAAVEEAGAAYSGYNSLIENYEGLQSAIIEGDTAKINKAINNLTYNFKTSTTATKEELEAQVENFQAMYDAYEEAIENGAPGVTQAQLDVIKEMLSAAEDELAAFPDRAETQGKNAGNKYAQGIQSKKTFVSGRAIEIANATDIALRSANTHSTGASIMEKLAEGIKSKMQVAQQSGTDTSDKFIAGVNSKQGDATSAGSGQANSFMSGLLALRNDIHNAGVSLGSSANSGAQEANLYNSGYNLGIGFSNGIYATLATVGGAGRALANNALNNLNKGLDAHSPSRKAVTSGGYLTQGFAIGIKKDGDRAIQAATDLAEETLNALNIKQKAQNFFDIGDVVGTSKEYESLIDRPASVTEKTNNSSMSLNVNIENFNNTREQDVKDFAEELLEYASSIKAREGRAFA